MHGPKGWDTAIERLNAAQAMQAVPELASVLCDAVDGGASLGFLAPLRTEDAERYWREVAAAIECESRILIVARDDQGIAGTVQLDPASKPNASHRAELMKLMVHRRARRQGLGRALIVAAEAAAMAAGRTLIILDTRVGNVAERLYLEHGYVEAGRIPGYTRDADGTMRDTVFFYRVLHV